jgi:ABC-type molybdate transport system permease subunit
MTEIEMWLVLVSASAAVVPWAFSIHAKVAVIASAVEHLPAMVQELRDALAEHENRLDQHETEIATLKASTRPSH